MSQTLLTVAVDVRRIIFKQLFASTTAKYGFGPTSSKNTSILRTCRLFSNEAKPLMAPNLSFHFSGTKAMIDLLSTLSSDEISKIRHIRLKGYPLPLYTLKSDRKYYTTYGVYEAFCMFPGLKLDRLFVEDCYHGDDGDGWGHVGTYHDIDGLIRMNGWKELYYITPATQFMTEFDEFKVRVAQPIEWNKMLLDRDGKDSGASVKMYVAKNLYDEGMATIPEERLDFEAVPGHPLKKKQGSTPTVEDYQDSEEDDDEMREVLVVAKRGIGASYAQDGTELAEDIKILLEKMSWKEIVADGRYVDGEQDPCAHL